MSRDLSGRSLERLVSILEGLLAGKSANIEVRSRRLRSRYTKKPREHDVLIIWDHGHHQIITAIECRNRARPVGADDVEAFSKKCEATGVHSAVIASSSGFAETARDTAEALNIACMDLAEVDRFDWLDAVPFVGYERRYGPLTIQIVFDGAQPSDVAEIRDPRGVIVDNELLREAVIAQIPPSAQPWQDVGKTLKVAIHANMPKWIAIDSRGEAWPISHLKVKVDIVTLQQPRQAKAYRYSGGEREYTFAQLDVDAGDKAGSVVMLQDTNDHVGVFWVPNLKKDDGKRKP